MNVVQRLTFAAVVAMVTGACHDASPPTGFGALPLFSTLAEVSQDPTPDQMAVAQLVTGFGGYFLDESGAPTVFLTDPSRRPEAEQALAGFLADGGFTAVDLVVRQGNYDYLQLDAWYNQAWPVALAVAGAVFSDLDEGSNRLRFGGVDASAVASMAAALAQLNVPSAAITVEETAPIHQAVTLQSRVRPVHGGYQINFFPSPVSPVTLVCTLGFNVVKGGVNSFITNSHCTNVQGGTETPTAYYQPLRGTPPNPNNFIGTEVEDPDYSFTNCLDILPGFRCRFSDAARAEYAAGVPFELGRIARTVERRNDPDFEGVPRNLTVDANQPSFRINGESKRSVLGQEANKVGRTTGWTFGPVIQTCINTIVLGTNISQRCQDRVRAGVAGGDSGSPVFRWRGGGRNVRLMGILWGSSTRDGRTTFVFSPMHGIHRELGDFRTH